ncbi:MAG: hypothetical protein R3F11_30450 [Verrucomicrobiales bacterium]
MDADIHSFDSLGIEGSRGMGRVDLQQWDGSNLPADRTVEFFWGGSSGSEIGGGADGFLGVGLKKSYRTPFRADDLAKDYGTGATWDLQKRMGNMDFSGIQVIILLIIFGVLVGPVNLFVFAKPGQRHRLFFTTPLISLGASLILLLLILLQDGIGGHGHRFIALILSPGEKKAFITQEQVCRTGVLLGRSFETAEDAFIWPVVLQRSAWTRSSASSADSDAAFALEGRTYSGDWFKSRSEQAHFAQSAMATRARLAVNGPADRPKLESSLEITLATAFYRDSDGKLWKAEGAVKAGQPADLVEATPSEFTLWKGELLALAAKHTRSRLDDLLDQRGQIYAEAETAGDFAIETLDSIDWEDHTLVVCPAAGGPI